MKNLSTTMLRLGEQHTDLLCAATAILSLIYALPLLEWLCHLPFAIWQQQHYPTGMLNALLELWIPLSNILSAAAFALLGIMLLKAPKHIMVPMAIAAIAAAELINGIANLGHNFMLFQSGSYSYGNGASLSEYALPISLLLHSVLSILYAVIWLLPIAARFLKMKSTLYVLIPAAFFLLRVILGLFIGSMSETYYISHFVQTAMIISLSILFLSDHQKSAMDILKSLK